MKKDGSDWGYKETGRIEPGYDERDGLDSGYN